MASGRPDYTSQALMRGSQAGTHRTVAVDSAGNIISLIKGQYGGSPVTVAVDASGNILGILQGDYEGALKTLAVDAQGRMLAVLTDPEDVFGNPHYLGAAELAARLGSPSVLDRRGQVIFTDPGGTNARQYAVTTSGASGAFVEHGGVSVLGPLCYKLTAGPSEDHYVKADKALPRVTLGGTGLEVTLFMDPNAKYVTLTLTASSATVLKTGAVRVDVDAADILYYKSDGTWDTLASLPSTLLLTEAHEIKLVIDPFTGKYIRLRWDDEEIDMAALSLNSAAGAYAQQIHAEVRLDCDTHGDAYAYQGPLLVTVNEE